MSRVSAEGMDFRRVGNLGDILVEVGVITPEQFAEARKRCHPDLRDLGDVLVKLGYTTEERFLKTVSLKQNIPYFTTFEGIIEEDAARLIPEAMARKHLILPVMRDEENLTLGMINPLDVEAIAAAGSYTGLHIQPVLTTIGNLFDAVEKLYGPAATGSPAAASSIDVESLGSPEDEKYAVDAVNMILEEAVGRKASDIHIEPAREKLRVRYRIDGIMYDAHAFPKEAASTVTARVKIMSKLDITETRVPQDGRFRFEYGDSAMDVRVSTLPAVYGEKLALRLLMTGRLTQLDKIGFSEADRKAFIAAIHQPNGIVLVTGPTGSGKTSTLYSALAELNTPERHIVTLEDPVEYHIEGINQVETNAKTGLTFAAGLRSILRQDPNVILVGEIRDLETAEIAIQAAITGHMVFSTLHTNDAVSAIHRLMNMKVEPFLLAASMRLVVAQRLMRRLCETCRRPGPPTEAEAVLLGSKLEGTFHVPGGCAACFNTGYSGRFPVFEVFSIDARVREAISRGASVDDLRAAARAGGLRMLQEQALDKAREGVTSLAEVIRVSRAD